MVASSLVPLIQSITQGSVHTTPKHYQLPNGPFKVWERDVIQLPLCYGCKYVLVMICIFSQ